MRITVSAGGAFALILCLAIVASGAPKEPITAEDLKILREEIARLRNELHEQKNHYDEKLQGLQDEIEQIRSQSGLESELAEEGSEDTLDSLLQEMTAEEEGGWDEGGSGLGGSAITAFQSFNPDISVIGDFIGHYTNREGGETDDEFLFRELEIGLSAPIDPYARADVFLGIHRHDNEWEIHLEEGYATFLTVPWGLQPRLGRFKSTFGKANPVHLHALPWIEYPLIIQNYFGEEGLSGDGVGVSWLVPNPWDRYIELTYESINNDSSLFAGEEADDFVHLFHLKDFFEVSDASTLEAGFSFATAPNDAGHGGNRTMIEGLDLTLKWRPPEAGLYKAFLWQTEFLAAQADLRGGQETSWGMYTATDYQFDRQWAIGLRYDYSQLPYSSSGHEHGYSTYLTFIQSEFLFWRLGYQYTNRNFEVCGNANEHELFLQCNFGIGPHRAHKY